MRSFTNRLQEELTQLKPAVILIVTADQDKAQVWSDHLNQHLCHLAANGRQAIKYCQATPPNLILIDSSLTNYQVLDLLQELLPFKTSHRTAIFVIDQPEKNQEIRMAALEMGVDDFLNEPIDLVELQYRVNNALPTPAKSIDLVTQLPAWPATHHELSRRLSLSLSDWSLIYIHIAYLDAYRDLFGSNAGRQIRQEIASLLDQVVDTQGRFDDFIGTVGPADFVIITTDPAPDNLVHQFTALFEPACRRWYQAPKKPVRAKTRLETPAPSLMVATTAFVSARHLSFQNSLEIMTIAEELRQRNHPANRREPVHASLQTVIAAF